MGVVYQGVYQDPEMAYPVMVKFSHPQKPKSSLDAEELFRREAQAMARLNRLNHENILRILDFDRLPTGQRYLVTDYLDGDSLGGLLGDHGLPVPQALDLLVQVADGLFFAHEIGVVHRDLHSNNVIVMVQMGRGWVCKIIDFGLAKSTEDAEGPGSDRPMGSPGFMAPEVWQQGIGPMTPAYDMYAFGCMIHDVVTGQPPFSGPIQGLARRHLREEPPALGARRPGVPTLLEQLTLRLLAKDPAARPTAAEAGRVLRRVRDALGDEAIRGARTIHDLATEPLIRDAGRNAELETLVLDQDGRICWGDGEATVPVDAEGALAQLLEGELARQGRRLGQLAKRLQGRAPEALLRDLAEKDAALEGELLELSLCKATAREARLAREQAEEGLWAGRMAGHEEHDAQRAVEVALRAEIDAAMRHAAQRRRSLRLHWERLDFAVRLGAAALAEGSGDVSRGPEWGGDGSRLGGGVGLLAGERYYVHELVTDLKDALALLERWIRA